RGRGGASPTVDTTTMPIALDAPWSVPVHGRSLMPMRRSLEAEFEAFFAANFTMVRSSVRFVCGDAARADDATQEAFIKAYARWGRIRRYDDPAAWVRHVAVNATRDAARSERRRADREARAHSPWPPPVSPPTEPQSPLSLLEHLPDRQRAVAALYYLDDMSTQEISRVLGLAEGTVRFHLSQARAALRASTRTGEEVDHGR